MKIVAYDAAGKEHRFSRLAAVETDWRCGSPAGSIAARILADALPPGLVSLRWYAAGGELLFEGVVDAARLVTGPEGRTLELEGRSLGSYLLDNEALPASYRGVGLREFGQRYFTAYGIFSYAFDPEGVRGSYVVPKGRSDWEAVSGFVYACTGRYPYLDRSGRLCLLPRTGRELLLSNREEGGLRFLSAEVEEDRSGVLSKVLVRDRYGYYPTGVENPAAAGLSIRSKRYLIPPSQYEDGREDAPTLIARSMADHRTARATLPGLQQVELGDRLRLDIAGTEPPLMQVVRVQHRFEETPTTRLWLAEAAYAQALG